MTRELVIVGAGPAGVSAALRARELDLEPLVLEAAATPGGQLLHVYFEPHDIAGAIPGDGPAIARSYARSLAERGIELRPGAEARSLEPASEPRLVLASGERLAARAILVACGVRRRRLDVPGERELEDRGLSFSATRDRERLAGRTVAVVGGGDAACENALLLADAQCDVTLIARDRLRAPRVRRPRRGLAAGPRARAHTGARGDGPRSGDGLEAPGSRGRA